MLNSVIFIQCNSDPDFPNKYRTVFYNLSTLSRIVRSCLDVARVCIITPEKDKPLKSFYNERLRHLDVGLFEGPNLIEQMDKGIKYFHPPYFARIKDDSPLLSESVLGWMLWLTRKNTFDFCSNIQSCVRGSEVQICSWKAWDFFLEHSKTDQEKQDPFSILNDYRTLSLFKRNYKFHQFTDNFNNNRFFPNLKLDSKDDIPEIRKHFEVMNKYMPKEDYGTLQKV